MANVMANLMAIQLCEYDKDEKPFVILQSRTMILTLGWVSLLVVFTWSISMVVWGRNGL